MRNAILILCLLASTVQAQPSAKIVGPKEAPAGEMVVLSSTGSTGDNLLWVKPEGLQTLQVGCELLDSQIVFATIKPGVYKFALVVADKQARIDYVEHSITIGKPTAPPPPPDPIPDPQNPAKWTGLQSVSKSGADKLNDTATRTRLKSSIEATIKDLEAKCAAGTCPTLPVAQDAVRKTIEQVLLTRVGQSAQIDWTQWRKANQSELDKQKLVDVADYLAAAKAIGSGL